MSTSDLNIGKNVFISHSGTAIPDPEVPSNVKLIRDLPFGEDPRQRYDLYLPDDASKPMPAVIFLHGGAWVRRDKRAIRTMYVLNHGYALVSIGYRLADAAPFPAQIQDVNAGLSHLARHAGNYGIDPTRLVIAGASAGGHLAALAALALDVVEFGVDPTVELRGVVSIYGVSDIIAMSGPIPGGVDHDSENAAANRLLHARVRDRPDLAQRASPIAYVSDKAPPFLLLHGDDDRVVPFSQSVLLDCHLRLRGRRSHIVRVHGAGHGDPAFQLPWVQQEVIAFLKSVV